MKYILSLSTILFFIAALIIVTHFSNHKPDFSTQAALKSNQEFMNGGNIN